jgi:hypothetical protein
VKVSRPGSNWKESFLFCFFVVVWKPGNVKAINPAMIYSPSSFVSGIKK